MLAVGTVIPMAWDRLWADLDAQAEAWDRQDLDDEVAERVRIEDAAVAWMDRVRASIGAHVSVRTRGGRTWQGSVHVCGVDVVVLASPSPPGGTHVVIASTAVLEVTGLVRSSAPSESLGPTAAQRTLRSVLRQVATHGSPVAVHLTDGSLVPGQVQLVGSDYVEVVDGRAVALVVPLAGLAAITPR